MKAENLRNTTFSDVEIGESFGFFEDGLFCTYDKTSDNTAILRDTTIETDFSPDYAVLAWHTVED